MATSDEVAATWMLIAAWSISRQLAMVGSIKGCCHTAERRALFIILLQVNSRFVDRIRISLLRIVQPCRVHI